MCDWFEEKPASRRYLLQLMMSTVRPHAIGFRRMITFDYVCFTSVDFWYFIFSKNKIYEQCNNIIILLGTARNIFFFDVGQSIWRISPF